MFEILSDSNINVCLLTETWLRKGDTSKIAEIKRFGYNIMHQSRAGRGGGVAIAYKKHLSVTRRSTKKYKSFELIESVMESTSKELLRLSCVYRSCTAKSSNIPDFCEEFEDYLDSLVDLPGKIMIAGDFNIHMEDAENPATKRMNQILSVYGMSQHINVATHIGGGILDLVITRDNAHDMLKVENVNVTRTVTSSDHFLISVSCSFPHKNRANKVQVSSRNLKNIDVEKLRSDIKNSKLNEANLDQDYDCETATELYNNILFDLLDAHAPVTDFTVNPERPRWLDTKCQTARCKRRKAERDHKRIGSEETRKAYKNAYKHAEAVINNSQNSYFKEKLEQSKDSKKDTYKIVNKLMDREVSKTLQPTHKPETTVCEELKDYFIQKIENIYSEFPATNGQAQDPVLSDTNVIDDCKWSEFNPITAQELREIVNDINLKDCEEDPLPIKLVMQCFDALENIILLIVNSSLREGKFPTALKNALVRPAIKNEKDDPNSYKNYRPISNLPFLSKVIEKSVQYQLNKHLELNDLHTDYQSGYRANHSCETATLAIYNDLLCLTDRQSKVVLLLLDLSAAFDTVHHELLLNKLNRNFGVHGNVLKWFKSYLSDRSFSVSIGKSKSSKCYLRIGVPQGSILGPILFILYTKDLVEIAKQHGFNIHLYADDTQLYIEFNPITQDQTRMEEKIIKCLEEITEWMSANKLKLNPSKTEALIMHVKSKISSQQQTPLQLKLDGEVIDTLPVAKSLGIKFDEYLTFEKQIESVLQSSYASLRNLRVIGSKLSYDLKRQLIHCLIFSKLDYCNGLYYDLPDYLLKKLQKIQNSCARFLFSSTALKRGDSITPYLQKAHFLPVKQRILFKIALMVFKCVNNIAPTYLQSMIKIKDQPTKTLRNYQDFFLVQHPPLSNLRRTDRSFSYCGPAIWNSLPYSLRTAPNADIFKKQLKTYLFHEAFNGLCNVN